MAKAGWFDKEWQKQELRSLSNKKQRDPANQQTRGTYQQSLKIYKSLLIQKKADHMKIKLNKIEEAVKQNYFWELWNNLDKSKEAKQIPIHDPNIWTEHFRKFYFTKWTKPYPKTSDLQMTWPRIHHKRAAKPFRQTHFIKWTNRHNQIPKKIKILWLGWNI